MSLENEVKKSLQEQGDNKENYIKIKGTVSKTKFRENEKGEEELELEDEYAIVIENGVPRRVPIEKDRTK